jgi:hypothetical protein
MIAADNIINVKQLLDSITDDEDVTFKTRRDGNYATITYKQMMYEILRDRTQVTVAEIIHLVYERLDDVISDHVYYSKN